VGVFDVIAAALLLLCMGFAPVKADDLPTIGELKRLNLEDLMNVEVTSVARHPERLLEAASVIQVITQDDIRRSGATSIPEALRLADNLQVGFSAHTASVVSTRASTQHPVAGRPLRILIVDDDPMLIKSLQDTLQEDGHQITATHVDKLLSKPPRLHELRAALSELVS
jgi:hypothetical protein